ncbi:MAG: hypothetical protein QXP70_02315, partial [Methanomassiliicoccales archaeon]
MISRNIGMAIAIVVVIVFAALSYVTIQRSSQGISTGLGKPAYLQISSSAQPLYMINGNTTSISFNITVYTAPTTLYLFDISPLNASSSTW